MSEPTWNPMSQQYEVGDTVTGPNGEKLRVLAEAMPVLPAFLLARIDEEAAAALRAFDQPMGYRWRTLSWLTEANRDHGLLHDPQRVLVECEAKRQIIAEHAPELGACRVCAAEESFGEDSEGNREYYRSGLSYPCPTLRLLASVYADHPDYDEAWRP